MSTAVSQWRWASGPLRSTATSKMCTLQFILQMAILIAAGIGAQLPSPPVQSSSRPPSPKPTTQKPPPPPRLPSPPPPPPPRNPPKPPSPPRPPPSPPKPPGKPRPPPRKPRLPQKPPAIPPRPPPNPPRTRSGVRLTRGAGRIGRLEVSFRSDYYPARYPYVENGGWAPLCDDGSFGPDDALYFCQVLGFKYGRQIYSPGISDFGADEVTTPTPVGRLTCDSNPEDIPVGQINLPDDDRICFALRSNCTQGVLVALQCTNAVVPPSRPPPPVPPRKSPPPATPSKSDMSAAIKLVKLENNLGYSDSEPDTSRVELYVNTSADGRTGASVWAPLCASADDMVYLDPYMSSTEYTVVANTACDQYDTTPNTWNNIGVGFVRRPALMPTTTDWPKGNFFNPASYTHWVTVVGGTDEGLSSLQEMQLSVSTTPCETGYLYSLVCVRSVMAS